MKQKWIIAYKIARYYEKKYVSIYPPHPAAVTEYFIKNKTKRNKNIQGPFACFDTLENVKKSCYLSNSHNHFNIKIFKAKIKLSKDKKLWFWNTIMEYGFVLGTIFADEVILLKEIK